MLDVNKREEGVAVSHLTTEPLKNPLWVAADTEMRTQYLPAGPRQWTETGKLLVSQRQ